MRKSREMADFSPASDAAVVIPVEHHHLLLR